MTTSCRPGEALAKSGYGDYLLGLLEGVPQPVPPERRNGPRLNRDPNRPPTPERPLGGQHSRPKPAPGRRCPSTHSQVNNVSLCGRDTVIFRRYPKTSRNFVLELSVGIPRRPEAHRWSITLEDRPVTHRDKKMEPPASEHVRHQTGPNATSSPTRCDKVTSRSSG